MLPGFGESFHPHLASPIKGEGLPLFGCAEGRRPSALLTIPHEWGLRGLKPMPHGDLRTQSRSGRGPGRNRHFWQRYRSLDLDGVFVDTAAGVCQRTLYAPDCLSMSNTNSSVLECSGIERNASAVFRCLHGAVGRPASGVSYNARH